MLLRELFDIVRMVVDVVGDDIDGIDGIDDIDGID